LVTIEPLATATHAIIPTGGKPAAPVATATATRNDFEAESADNAPLAPAATPTPTEVAAPTEGRWIDVDVTNFVVRLMEGEALVQEIAPVAVGTDIDTGAYLSTQAGLFHVTAKDDRLVFDAPFNTYISHWVAFDPARDNGFHSFLKDATGNVVDASTGRVSNGCIRTADPEAVYAFAEVGMPVLVHW
jgi:hypothetical protein